MERGFTILELLVAIALMVLVMAAVFGNYPEFNRRVALDGIANKVALTIREAQVNSVAGRKFGTAEPGCYPGYGVHFDTGTPTSYTLFADPPLPCPPNGTGDGNYTPSASPSETVQTISLKQGYVVTDITVSGGACASVSSAQLTVLFPKRNTGAMIKNAASQLCDTAVITVSKTGTSLTKQIYVGISGHAYVQ